ncbi:MAG: hypothetical protein RIR11_1323 [Bacteroidota bacterium]|jgi:hypothetical protein
MNPIYRYWLTFTGLCGAVFYVLRYYKAREKYLSQLSCDALNTPEIPTKIHKRLKKYIPVFLVIEYFYTLLTGITLDKEQIKRSTLLCGITPTFDDMIDDYDYTTDQIMSLVRGITLPIEPESKCAIHFYQEGGFEWNHYWDHTLAIQTESIHQKAKGLTQDELLALTREKGGISVVFGWHVITQEHGGNAIAKAAYELGAYAQIINDIYDVYYDRASDIVTLVTQSNDIRRLTQIHDLFYHQLQDSLADIPVGTRNKKQLKALIVLLYALGKVALAQLSNLQSKNKDLFDVHAFSQKDLVCDMANWSNRIKWGLIVLHPKSE